MLLSQSDSDEKCVIKNCQYRRFHISILYDSDSLIGIVEWKWRMGNVR